MPGWIAAAVLAVVAAAAIIAVITYHRRRLTRLRSAHEDAIRRRESEHHSRVDRLRRHHQQQLDAAHHPLAEDLFPVLDSLDEAQAHLDDDHEMSPDDLREGLQIARRALYDALQRHGITPVEPEPGDPFDPSEHEAISRSETPEMPPDTVRRRFRRGFRDDDRVLRAAMVEVNVAPDQRDETPQEAGESRPDDSEPPPEDESEPPPEDESEPPPEDPELDPSSDPS